MENRPSHEQNPGPSIPAGPSAAIADAIAMYRMPWVMAADGSIAPFSADGSRFATVVWRGDLERDVNVYELLVFDTEGVLAGRSKPQCVLSVDFAGDEVEQRATPLEQISFLGDHRLVFIGTLEGEPRQVYALDIGNGDVEQLTKHPTDVRSYALGPDGSVRMYSAVAPRPSDDPEEILRRDGGFAADERVFWGYRMRPFLTSMLAGGPWPRRTRQYFLVRPGEAPQLAFDSRQSRPPTRVTEDDVRFDGPMGGSETVENDRIIDRIGNLSADPTGRYVLLRPYALSDYQERTANHRWFDTQSEFVRSMSGPYGLVDLETGTIETLIDAPHPMHAEAAGPPLWIDDGQSVLIYTLLPLDGDDPQRRAKEPPQWVQVDITTRRVQPLGLPEGWRVFRWDPAAQTAIVRHRREVGAITRTSTGQWSALRPTGVITAFKRYAEPGMDGSRAITVVESPDAPPELAACDLSSGSLTVLTELNSALRERVRRAVEEIEWKCETCSGSGYLLTPPDSRPDFRHPLALLFDDGVLGRIGDPRDFQIHYFIDGGMQLSGHPVQALVSAGIAVLYSRFPSTFPRDGVDPHEGDHARDSVEAAVDLLDEKGIIDPTRVGLSGWSRAAFLTDYVLIHSRRRFAAASQIDGGTGDYINQARPFRDAELANIRTPLLLEGHGPRSFVTHATMADRMNSLGGVAESLYFPTAPHSTVTPRHRLRSMTAHLDWFRFWLQDYEDPDPEKERQYLRWRALRKRMASPQPMGSGYARTGMQVSAREGSDG